MPTNHTSPYLPFGNRLALVNVNIYSISNAGLKADVNLKGSFSYDKSHVWWFRLNIFRQLYEKLVISYQPLISNYQLLIPNY